ncbi:hypothetical protein PsorP6_005618 [Peronosclerospora sorghi]|uniref:Uncharacterized protein n=1 Tax=Peronosclerospora sorghi TaxID=230839 RepID=A0ACC0W4I3_9STRA|nr:hypothetical protein PsorP6_005618 [Peronosclerospora sorghi]
MAKAGATPRVILETLRQADPKCLLVGKDIYNTKQKARNSLLNGRQTIEVFLDRFRQESIYHAFRRSASGRLLSLFFAPKTGISLAAEFSSNLVFIMDSTYKTNRYKLPLLNIVGVMPTNQTVSVAYAFLSEESEDDYAWALRQFNECFKLLINETNMAILLTGNLP